MCLSSAAFYILLNRLAKDLFKREIIRMSKTVYVLIAREILPRPASHVTQLLVHMIEPKTPNEPDYITSSSSCWP